jgi:hypothetical protein
MFSFVCMFLKPHLHFILTIRKTTKNSYVVEYVFKDLHARPDFRSQEDLLLVFIFIILLSVELDGCRIFSKKIVANLRQCSKL